jgi:hypothetical protein
VRLSRDVPVLPAIIILAVAGIFAYTALRSLGGGDDASGDAVRDQAPQPAFAPEAVFVSPRDGEAVSNPIRVHMAVGGVRIMPASEPARPGEGHFRLLLNAPPPAPGERPGDEYTLLDLADGAHTAMIELEPGEHTLTLIFEDSDSRPLEPLLTDTITITVTE